MIARTGAPLSHPPRHQRNRPMNPPNDDERLAAVFAPVVVGVPPTNAIRDLMRLPDGELRHYGFHGIVGDDHRCVHLVSHDNGFTWSEHVTPPGMPGASVHSPWSGDWLTVLCSTGHAHPQGFHDAHRQRETGTWVYRSSRGPDGPWQATRITAECFGQPRQPIALRCRRRWLSSGHIRTEDGGTRPAVLLSDDDGQSWRMITLPALPRFEQHGPHRGMRWWRCGDEPTVAELPDGRLYMLMRTAHDQLWESWSQDGGEVWSEPVPSRFNATITTPLLHTLADGRVLAVWLNTRPLPELDHTTQAGLNDDGRSGWWEDLMTNRDAIHAAISDDGVHWRGFRELVLNERRNDGDFRSSGGTAAAIDKGLNQSQAVDLPGGRVLLAIGQHPLCRRLVIVDPDWLLEEERRDDFRHGFEQWSVHQYLIGLAGGYVGFSGHCSLNRRAGAALVPDPGGRNREVLRIARHPDPRLLDDREGAVWNFPAGRCGRLRIGLRLPTGSAGARIALLDHWSNPTDPVVEHDCACFLCIAGDGTIAGQPGLTRDRWQELTLRWNLDHGEIATWQIDDGPEQPLNWVQIPLDGLSYLHLQTLAMEADPHGLLIEAVAKDGEHDQ